MSEDQAREVPADEAAQQAPAGGAGTDEVMTELPPETLAALRKAFGGEPSTRTRVVAVVVGAFGVVGAVVTAMVGGKLAVKAVRRVRRR